ncbi:hypothetical protein RFI_22232, partial [Reticulomyxa filosa]
MRTGNALSNRDYKFENAHKDRNSLQICRWRVLLPWNVWHHFSLTFGNAGDKPKIEPPPPSELMDRSRQWTWTWRMGQGVSKHNTILFYAYPDKFFNSKPDIYETFIPMFEHILRQLNKTISFETAIASIDLFYSQMSPSRKENTQHDIAHYLVTMFDQVCNNQSVWNWTNVCQMMLLFYWRMYLDRSNVKYNDCLFSGLHMLLDIDSLAKQVMHKQKYMRSSLITLLGRYCSTLRNNVFYYLIANPTDRKKIDVKNACAALVWYLLLWDIEQGYYVKQMVHQQLFIFKLNSPEQGSNNKKKKKKIANSFTFSPDLQTAREQQQLYLKDVVKSFKRTQNQSSNLSNISDLDCILDYLCGIENKYLCSDWLELKSLLLELLCFNSADRFEHIKTIVLKHNIDWSQFARIWFENRKELTYSYLLKKSGPKYEEKGTLRNLQWFLMDDWQTRMPCTCRLAMIGEYFNNRIDKWEINWFANCVLDLLFEHTIHESGQINDQDKDKMFSDNKKIVKHMFELLKGRSYENGRFVFEEDEKQSLQDDSSCMIYTFVIFHYILIFFFFIIYPIASPKLFDIKPKYLYSHIIEAVYCRYGKDITKEPLEDFPGFHPMRHHYYFALVALDSCDVHLANMCMMYYNNSDLTNWRVAAIAYYHSDMAILNGLLHENKWQLSYESAEKGYQHSRIVPYHQLVFAVILSMIRMLCFQKQIVETIVELKRNKQKKFEDKFDGLFMEKFNPCN